MNICRFSKLKFYKLEFRACKNCENDKCWDSTLVKIDFTEIDGRKFFLHVVSFGTIILGCFYTVQRGYCLPIYLQNYLKIKIIRKLTFLNSIWKLNTLFTKNSQTGVALAWSKLWTWPIGTFSKASGVIIWALVVLLRRSISLFIQEVVLEGRLLKWLKSVLWTESVLLKHLGNLKKNVFK